MERSKQDFMKCPICGDLFNPEYLDQVAKHMHTGVKINQTIKGKTVEKEIRSKRSKKPSKQEPPKDGWTYKLWQKGTYVGIGTWTTNEKNGEKCFENTFWDEKKGKMITEVYDADVWEKAGNVYDVPRTQIRVNDWYTSNLGWNFRWKTTDWDVYLDGLKGSTCGIELSTSLLHENCGFKNGELPIEGVGILKSVNRGTEVIFTLLGKVFFKRCKYIHELQNLFIRLTGKELEVKEIPFII
jgi:hypothetical protein